jgi:predicted secreted protein
VPTLADYPDLVAQIDRKKNGRVAPETIAKSSKLRLFWRCPAGPDHVWEAPVRRRTMGHGCPACQNLQISVTNNLAKLEPEIAEEWHPTKNGKLTPRDVVPGYYKAVWWKCPRGRDHVWRKTVCARVYGGRGCPFCAGQRPSAGHNLAVDAPRVAKEWHPTKNGDLKPRDVTLGSRKAVWWKCPKGADHEWSSSVYIRKKGGCPFCANMRISSTNSLAAVAPAVAAQWHPTKNGKLRPRDVIAGSNRRVWWKCPKAGDHEWPASIANRLAGTTCPFCLNRRLCASNSLAVAFPKIAAEWHPTKNGKLTPRDIVGGGARRVWWRCAFGHVWAAFVFNRTQKGSNCPECWRLRRRRPVVTTGKRGRPVHLASYEGAHHGPVRRVK